MMVRKVVVFPAPFRPIRQTSSPAATDRLMPLRMRLPSMSTFKFDKLNITAAFSKLRASSHDGGNHSRIGKERVGRHVGKQRTRLQGDNAMRVTFDEVHVVLDLHDGTHTGGLGGR